ncbi:MAG: hypothetical protein IJT30_02775 [Muribaculaceae bacterium]|nr:hypothetical protein [Muribaculaceae bacterium]
MTIDDIKSFLEEEYAHAMRLASGKDKPICDLEADIRHWLDIVINRSESAKGVFTVLLTSVVYKIVDPNQDIRIHQSDIPGGNGYSGRSFDTKYITPFLKEHRFPSMAESGWLTRSLEQKSPYNLDYKGAIRPAILKDAFLKTLNGIEQGCDCRKILSYILQSLIIQRDSHQILLAKPQKLRIPQIVELLDSHFHHKYQSAGASRLPVLALFALYQSMIGFGRFENKILLPLEKHTSADSRSGRFGDIDITDADKTEFEAVEVKFDIPITLNIVERAIEKIQPSALNRYYILSTASVRQSNEDIIEKECRKLSAVHGCQLIVNGVLPTIKYLLRIVTDTGKFVSNYVSLLESDETINFEHKLVWNELVSNI